MYKNRILHLHLISQSVRHYRNNISFSTSTSINFLTTHPKRTCCNVLYGAVRYRAVRYCTVLYITVLHHCTVLVHQNNIFHLVQYALNSTALYCTAKFQGNYESKINHMTATTNYNTKINKISPISALLLTKYVPSIILKNFYRHNNSSHRISFVYMSG